MGPPFGCNPAAANVACPSGGPGGCTDAAVNVGTGGSDNCVTGTPIVFSGCNTCMSGTTVGATSTNVLYGACNGSSVNEVWFSFVAQGGNNDFTITPGTMTDPMLIIDGSVCTDGVFNTCATETGTNTLTSSWGFSPGQQVWVGVASNGGTEGTFELCVESYDAPAGNGNTCAGALEICDQDPYEEPNTNCYSASGQQPSCFGAAPQQDVWLTFTVYQGGTIEFSGVPVTNSEFDWALWDISSGCGSGTVEACNYNFSGSCGDPFGMGMGQPNAEYEAAYTATAGQVLALQVDNYSGNGHGFDLTWGGTALIAPVVDFSIDPTGPQCASTVDVTITDASVGSVDYDFGNGNTYSGNTPPIQTYSGTSVYSITGSINDGNCTATNTEYVELYGPLSTTLTPTNVSCGGNADGVVSAQTEGGDGNYTYLWDNAGETTPSITGLLPGVYSVTIENALCGTSVTASSTVTDGATLPISTTITPTLCFGSSDGTLTAIPGGGVTPYSYQWSDVGGQTTQTATGLPAGNYSVTLTDGNTCVTVTTASVTQPSIVSVSTSATDASCGSSNGAINTTVSGGTGSGYTYSWQDGQTTANPTGIPSGSFEGTITDANGCSVTVTEIIGNTSFSVSITSQTNVSCSGYSGGDATVTEIGGITPFTYLWSNGQTDATATGFSAGSFNVTVEDNTSCTAVAWVSITEPSAVVIGTSESNVSCTGDATGVSTLTVSGGVSGYTYQWDANAANQTTQVATGLLANTYTVTVQDVNLCPTVANITITEPLAALAAGVTCSPATTNGGSEGAATSAASGGTSPYSYSWSNTQTTSTAIGLNTGSQTVTITDSNGCIATSTCSVTEPICALGVTPTPTSVQCFGNSDGEISIATSGGFSPLTYSWSSTQTTQNIVGIPIGVYTLTVTDNALCVVTVSGTITEPSALALNSSCTDVSGAGNSDGASSVTVTGGTSGYTYSWNNGNTTANNTGLPTGNYAVTVTDDNGCVITGSCIINDPGCSTTVSINSTDVACIGENNGSVTVTAGAGLTPYSFSWNNGITQTTATVTGLSPNNYTVTVTDGASCITITAIDVFEPNALAVSSLASESNCTITDGSVSTTVTGGTTPYNYNWSNSQTSANATGMSIGIYTATITDARGCTVSLTETITNPTPDLTINSVSNIRCFGDSDGAATIGAVGGTTPYSYNWDNGGTNATTTGLSVGIFGVTVSDVTGCTSFETVTIQEAPAVSATSAETMVNCGGQSDGTSTITASGGISNFTYNWSASAGNQITAVATGLAAGIHSVTVADGFNCQEYLTITITEPAPIVFGAAGINVSCFGFSDGAVSTSISGGTTPYAYTWSNGSTTQNVNGLGVGIYQVTVEDATSCTSAESITLTQPTELVFGSSVTPVSCPSGSDGTATVSASGGISPYTYLWDNGETTATISGLIAGNPVVSISDNNGCVVNEYPSNCIEITRILVDACGSPEGEEEMFFMETGPSILNTSSITISWPNTSLSFLGICTNPTWVANTNATITGGGYLVEPPASGDIPPNSSVLVTTSAAPTISSMDFSALADTVYVIFQCAGNTNGHFANYGTSAIRTLELNIGGGCGDTVSYDRNLLVDTNGVATGSPSGVRNGATVNFEYDGTATYTNDGCIAPFDPYTIGIDTIITLTISELPPMVLDMDSTAVNCNGNSNGTATVSVTGGTSAYTYLWDSNANGQTSATATGLGAMPYVVTTTDNNGCVSIGNITVTEPPALTVSTSTTQASCNSSDGTATVSASGGYSTNYTYVWPGGQITATATGLAAGLYSVIVIDENSCIETALAAVNNPSPILIFSDSTMVTCFGGSNGSATIAASGGATPYSFNWTNGATSATATGLSGGVNFVTVTDLLNCIAFESINIIEPPELMVDMDSTSVLCFGENNGTAVANVSGGGSPYQYAWSVNTGSQTNATATGLAIGGYDVTVTDDSLCLTFGSITVTEPDLLSVANATLDNLCHGDSAGSVMAVVTGGAPSYGYLWSNGETSMSITGLFAGSYGVTVNDQHGCTAEAQSTISEPAQPISSVLVGDTVLCFGDQNGSVSSSVVGGTTPYVYQWDTNTNSQTTQNATGLGAGAYLLTITDDFGCKNYAGGVINQPTELAIASSSQDVLCYGDASGEITTAVVGGTTPYQYTWSNGSTSINQTGLSGSTLELTITDVNNCVAIHSATVTEPITALSVTSSLVSETCGASDGVAQIDGTGGTSPYTYLWASGETTNSLSGLATGNYSVLIVDANNCASNQTIFVGSIGGVSVSLTSTDAICNGTFDGTATTTVSGTLTPYTYVWSNGETTPNLTGINAGNYTVTVIDATGCDGSATITVSEPNPLTYSTSTTPASCLDNDGIATVSTNSSYSYIWSNGESSANATGLASGNYTVTISDASNCSATLTLSVGAEDVVVAEFTYSQDQAVVPAQFTFENLSTGASFYTWSFGNSQQDTVVNPTTLYTESGVYTIMLVASADTTFICTDTASVEVEIIGNSFLSIPIVFSPNGDGVNDIYKVDASSITSFKATIYNRWGAEMYSWDNVNTGWDGRTYSGTEVPDGTYFILVEAVGIDGVEYNDSDSKKSITLIRER